MLFKNTSKYKHWKLNMFKSHWPCWALNFKPTCNTTFSEIFSAAQHSASFCRLVSLLIISGCISCSKYASSWLSKNSPSSISSSMKREENISTQQTINLILICLTLKGSYTTRKNKTTWKDSHDICRSQWEKCSSPTSLQGYFISQQ